MNPSFIKKSRSAIMLLAAGLITTTSFANSEARLDTVKSVYAHALYDIQTTGDYEAAEVLYPFANRDLRYAIDLIQSDSGVDDEGALTECHQAGWGLNLLSSNGWGLEEATALDFTELGGGDVRVRIDFDGGYDIKDYSLLCNGNSCEISDSIDVDGVSALANIMQMCL
ncbi:hypothetical protein [Psychrobacter sp. FDAARGOS_221]|uniref:hypothetical protein n=1 Tax=Psychrobacter sp. FDAARGOS_221 TaxID=1975705 RepID=UPI000BB56E48|nr:hypothetical protein [Psychrobacter sp. FDAARGOS_221]PNK59491.1 hypothetical protein A6J60_000380 [Psychrobacter sp. FDAARGOS_221]